MRKNEEDCRLLKISKESVLNVQLKSIQVKKKFLL